jgi:tRNA dimethylallyltransferase
MADVATLRRRIDARVAAMFAAGLVEEVRRLRDGYPQWSHTARQAIGYAEALACLEGRMDLAAAAEQTVRRTVQLAKRQRTWFTRQVNVRWIPVGDSTDAGALGEKVLECWRECGPALVAG